MWSQETLGTAVSVYSVTVNGGPALGAIIGTVYPGNLGIRPFHHDFLLPA